jgi:hypothetical protein
VRKKLREITFDVERGADMNNKPLTGAEKFWYVLQCIWFGAGYFAKVPVKKAMSERGLCQMTSAESFWYVLGCIFFGASYFQKVIYKKALSEAKI